MKLAMLLLLIVNAVFFGHWITLGQVVDAVISAGGVMACFLGVLYWKDYK